MSVIRAFVAIDLPNDVRHCLDKISSDLQSNMLGIPIRWVPVNNIHLTLKFLGDVSINNIDVLKQILDSEVKSLIPFEISIGGIGAFPNLKRPRVIWISVEAPSELLSLQRGIEAQTTRLGYRPDKRPFSAHLTLGRVSRNANPRDVRQAGEVLNHKKVGFIGVARIASVHLYRSDLKPKGAVYSCLHTATFGG
ncbi:MAG TPA: RNA 2',3'-cyclic phosphodiesterase [Anaerolineae bacterium]|nr:RNA 2',3'-cyclic phosphodiesterase [Anaerolineae bacterium]